MNKNRKTLKMPVRYLMNAVLVVLLFLALSYMTGNMLSTYQNKVLMTVGINIILAVSLNVATGYLGQLPLGHAGFMAVGAYTCALFTKYCPLPGPVSFVLGLVLACVMAGLFGVLIGIPALRLTARPWRDFIIAWMRKQVMTTQRKTFVKLEYLGMFFRPLAP